MRNLSRPLADHGNGGVYVVVVLLLTALPFHKWKVEKKSK